MKILTKEEEAAHYNATVKGGSIGGAIGVAAGLAGVTAASMRFPIIRHLTLPMKAFLVTSTGTFAAITSADSASRNYEKSQHPEEQYKDEASRADAERKSKQSSTQNAFEWAREHRYHIVGASWAASMGLAFALVHRSPLSTAQKLVQARVYAQGLTVAVLVATAAFEISDQRNDKGRYETIQTYDPNDPTHKRKIDKRVPVHKEEYEGEDQWKDMVKQEEQRLKTKEQEIKEYEAQHPKKSHKKPNHEDEKKHEKSSDKKNVKQNGEKSDDKKTEKKDKAS